MTDVIKQFVFFLNSFREMPLQTASCENILFSISKNIVYKYLVPYYFSNASIFIMHTGGAESLLMEGVTSKSSFSKWGISSEVSMIQQSQIHHETLHKRTGRRQQVLKQTSA